mmetsp:Transcript_24452/g.61685  ORF Transcript_24452/g.61685 Transcript_24452/m.61685 type:complete len:114 (+) Transcript_24452:68-409(+)
MKDEDVFRGLAEIEKTIRGPKFEEWRKKFVDENIDTFTYDDENKLEYTAIHAGQRYEAQIEQMVEESLPKDIAMSDFQGHPSTLTTSTLDPRPATLNPRPSTETRCTRTIVRP